MLQTIREYAVERLARLARLAGELRPPARRVLRRARGTSLFVALAGEAVDEAYATFEREHDNYRAALAFAGQTRVDLESALPARRGGLPLLARARTSRRGSRLARARRSTLARGREDIAAAAACPAAAQAGDARVAARRFRPRRASTPRPRCRSWRGRSTRTSASGSLILLGCIEYSRRRAAGAAALVGAERGSSRESLENDAPLALALSNLGVVVVRAAGLPRGGVAIYEESVDDGAPRRPPRVPRWSAARARRPAPSARPAMAPAAPSSLESLALYRRLGLPRSDRVLLCLARAGPRAPRRSCSQPFGSSARQRESAARPAPPWTGRSRSISRSSRRGCDPRSAMRPMKKPLRRGRRPRRRSFAEVLASAAAIRPQWPVRTCVQPARWQSPDVPALDAAGAPGMMRRQRRSSR